VNQLISGTDLKAFLGFFERQTNLLRRYWTWEAVWFFYSLVSVLSIGFLASGLPAVSAAADNSQTKLYLLIGALLWSYLSLVFAEVAHAINWERWEDSIEYTFIAPVRRAVHLLGICAFAILYGILRSLLVLGVAALVFKLDFSQANVLGAVTVLAVATVPLVGLGILVSVFPLLSVEKGEQLVVAVQGFLLLVSGVYYPISVLPWPMQALGTVSPLTYTLSAIRASLLQGRGIGDQIGPMALLLAMGLLLIPTGLWVFSLAEKRAKRLGLLKRNG
jgi:ABC-2 type transport system permease protein